MKKLGILFIIFALIFSACEQSLSQKEKKQTRQKKKTEQVKTPAEQQTATIYYEPTPLSDDGNSYWFVVVEKKDGTQKLNTYMKQNHRWFSAKEAIDDFGGGVFILNIVQVSRETYENQ